MSETPEDFSTSVSLPPTSRRILLLLLGVIVISFCAVTGYLYHQVSLVPNYMPPATRPIMNAPYVATPQIVVDEMLKQAKLSREDIVYDLGCGDGRILIAAAKQFGCRGIGFDLDLDLVNQARENAKEAGVEDLVTIEIRDIFTVDLKDASVVMLYLLPSGNAKLVPQLLELKPGTRIVSHDFGIQGYKPDHVITVPVEGAPDHLVHVWLRPLEKTVIPIPAKNRRR